MRCVWCVALAVVAVVVMVEAAMEDVEVDVVDIEPKEVPIGEVEGRSQATGRTFMEWGRTILGWMGWDYEDDEYYDDDDEYYDDYEVYYPPSASAQVGYGLPSVGYVPPSAGGSQSTYSSYQPIQVAPHPQHLQHFHGSHHPARHDTYEDDEWTFTDVLYNLGMAAIPMGLLYSALPAGLFTVVLRRRSMGDNTLTEEDFGQSQLPLLHAITENDQFHALMLPSCQRKLFCEIAQIGELESASTLQRAIYFVATLTPDFMAKRVGLARLFRKSRAGDCKVFHCPAVSDLNVPPPIAHSPSDTNKISEVAASPEKDAAEVSKQ